jgi:hypothetical protein
MVYKRLNKNKKNALVVASIILSGLWSQSLDILEIWEYQCSIARSDKKKALENDTIMFVEFETRYQRSKKHYWFQP